jgi:hypothetical protein
MSRIKKVAAVFSSTSDGFRNHAETINRLADLVQPFGSVPVSAAFTVSEVYATYLADVTAAGFTVTLPPAAAHKWRRYSIIKVDASGNTLTLAGDGSETINGTNTKTTTTQWAGWTVESDGTQWIILP